MRGRRGRSSSSVSQEQTRMALRKQALEDASDVPSGSQEEVDKNTPEDESADDRDDNDELSSSLLPSLSREKRKRERATASKPKEMTEEEMMDLALRLSEQEASVTAIRLQQEEEAVMKAIHESMVNQTQPAASQSQSLLADAETSLSSRRKLLYSNGKTASGIDQGALEEVCTPEVDPNPGAKGTGDERDSRNKKRKKKEGSPLLEMPDLSQTQRIYSQASPCSSECPSAPLDSPQSSDSIQIDDGQLRKSPVFPSSGCRAEVHIPQLSQDLLEACRTSGFVLCTQDSWTLTRQSPPAQPKSPQSSNNPTLSKSPVFSETDQGDDGETELCPEHFKSPEFGGNTQHETSPSACKTQVCNSGFTFSSQESVTSSVRSKSCRPESPVFPRSPGLPKNFQPPERSATCRSPIYSETGDGQTKPSLGCCTIPVLGRTGRLRRKVRLDEQKRSVSPSAAKLSGSNSDGNSTTARDPSRSARQDSKADRHQDDRFNNSSKSGDAEEEPSKICKDRSSAETELSSDMTLLWSDDDVTLVDSPSPVFPEERPVQRADREDASWSHVSAASPEINCRPSTSSTSTGQQQLSTQDREPRPISSQGTVSGTSAPPGEPTGRQTVYYYWGVPFCPRGADPDKYTRVILDQMEGYEKSLKQAQRCLLRKAEWGEAVLPQPEKSPSPESPAGSPQLLVPRRRGLRLGGRKACERDESPPAEGEEDGEGRRDEEEGEERGSQEEEKKKEEEEEGEDGGQVDTDDCEVCPETQLSNNDDDRTQDVMMATDAGAELGFQFDRRKSPEPPEIILRDDSPAGAERRDDKEEEMEVDAQVERKPKRSLPVGTIAVRRQRVRKASVEEDGGDPDVEEIKDRGLQWSPSPELEPAAVSQEPGTKVDCPICQGSFPASEIERHAADCDGEVAVVDERRPKKDCFQVSLKPRRKRTRGAKAEETYEPSTTDRNLEKCYVCQKAVSLRDFSRHTELCIQRHMSKTAAKGNLLSALDQTDSRDSAAGTSGSQLQPGDVIDLLDDDDDEEEEGGGGVSTIKISNSPIRSFTPISEANGCLIDFKKQQRPKKLRQRRR